MKKSRVAIIFACILGAVSCLPGEDIPSSGNGNGSTDNPLVDDNSSIVYTPGENGVAWYRIPSIVRTTKGTLLAFAEARNDRKSDNSDIDVVLKRSEDGGRTWSESMLLVDYGPDKTGNQSPVVLPDGKILLLYSICKLVEQPDGEISSSRDRQVYIISSEDDGKTWTKANERELTPELTSDGIPYHTYCTCPVHGIVKEYEPNKGRVVVAARCNKDGNSFAHIIYSDDNGETWHQGGGMSDYLYGSECTVAELCDGTLVLNSRDGNDSDDHRYQAYSSDGGITFGPTEKTQLREPPTGCLGSMLRYGKAEDSGETILLFSNPTSLNPNRLYGAVKASWDSGKNWTKMCMYVDRSGLNKYTAYSDLVLLDGEQIGVLYEAGAKYTGGIVFKRINFSDINEKYELLD